MTMKLPEVFITGSNGFIGKALSQRLSESGYRVIGSGRSSSSINDIEYYLNDWSTGMPAIGLDVRFDYLIHTAARTPRHGGTFQDFFRDNVIGTENVLQFAQKHRVKKIIFMQGVSAYGKIEDVLSENSPHNNPDDYGLSKYIAEKLLTSSMIACDTFILPGVIGIGCNRPYIYRLAEKLCKGQSIQCYNSEGLFNNVLYINDLVDFVLLRLQEQNDPGENFILGCDETIRVEDMVNWMRDKLNSNSSIDYNPNKNGAFTLDVTKALKYGFSSESIYNIMVKICSEVCPQSPH